MNKNIKIFVLLVALGFASSMLFSLIDWEYYARCLEQGLFQDETNKDDSCSIAIPQVFGQAAMHVLPPYKQLDFGVLPQNIACSDGLMLILRNNGDPACVKPETKERLIQRGLAKETPSGFRVTVAGNQQVRGGTTHEINVKVTRDGNPVPDSMIRITIEDYGEDIIREFKGYTDQSGRFVFSWEAPDFDDVEILLAYIDATDDVSAQTVLFKFQVYCLPGEPGCKIKGN